MREAFISILTILAVASPVRSSDKDGFNFYKDYLRGKSDDGVAEIPSSAEKMLYFYRTPVQLYPELLPALVQEYRKRTGNAFKNHMLSKELLGDGEAPGKRSSKTALALMLEGKHPYQPTNDRFACYSNCLNVTGRDTIVRTANRSGGDRASVVVGDNMDFSIE